MAKGKKLTIYLADERRAGLAATRPKRNGPPLTVVAALGPLIWLSPERPRFDKRDIRAAGKADCQCRNVTPWNVMCGADWQRWNGEVAVLDGNQSKVGTLYLLSGASGAGLGNFLGWTAGFLLAT